MAKHNLKFMVQRCKIEFNGIAEGKIKLECCAEILRKLHDIAGIKQQASALGQYSYEDVLNAQSDALSREKEIAKISKELKEYFARLSNFTGNVRYGRSECW